MTRGVASLTRPTAVAAIATIVGVAAAVAVVAVLAVVAATAGSAPPASAAPPDTVAPATAPADAVDNVFLPEDRDLSDCISAVPQPGCGSRARGGWRQGLVFATVMIGLGLVGWRIVRAVRRTRPDATVEEP